MNLDDENEEWLSEFQQKENTKADEIEFDQILSTGSTIVGCNIRSLPCNWDNMREFLVCLKNINNLKIICLQEVFRYDPTYKLEGYKIMAKTRRNQSRGGVAIVAQESMDPEQIEEHSVFIEGLYESIAVKIPSVKWIVISLYRPNGCHNSNTEEFINILKESIKQIKNDKKLKKFTIIIVGDLNIDIRNSKCNYANSLINLLINNDFVSEISNPTRISNQGNTKTCIDQIWIRGGENLTSKRGTIEDQEISDHYQTFIRMRENNKNQIKVIETRDLSENSIKMMKDDIRQQKWDDVYQANGAQEKVIKLLEVMRKSLDKNCKIKECKINNRVKLDKPEYMTEGLWNSRKDLLRKKRDIKKSRDIQEKERLENDLKARYKIYYSTRRKAKRNFYYEKFKDAKHDPREMWKILNDLIKDRTQSKGVKELKVGEEIITDKLKISNEFNKFFSEVGEKTGEEIAEVDKDPMSYMRGEPPDSLYLYPTSNKEIIKMIKQLKKKKSKGYDKIPCMITIEMAPHMTSVLTHVINQCIDEGTFPEALKRAIVVPIHKKLEKNNTTNYRPVSLLIGLSKIYEKILFNRIYDYLEKNDILIKEQFGFRPKMGTNDLMFYMLEKTCQEIDTGKWCVMSMFDLKKAFDTIRGDILIKKLEKMGLRGKIGNILDSYMKDRSNVVLVNETESNMRKMTYGVPQGSILGPLLFILYTNCIVNATQATLGIYADDTNCLTFGQTKIEAIEKTKKVLNELGTWFACNRLALSPSKCKFAIINKKLESQQRETVLTIYGEKLEEIRENTNCTSNPFVGLMLNEKMDFKNHLAMLKKKLRNGLQMLRKHRTLPQLAKKNIYFALCHSHMIYAACILKNVTRKEQKDIEKIQNNCIRAIKNSKYNEPVNGLYKDLKILKYRDIITAQCVNIAHRYFYGELPKPIKNLIKIGNERTKMLQIPRYSCAKLKNLSPLNSIAESWNSLDESTRKISKIKAFKTRVMETIIKNY